MNPTNKTNDNSAFSATSTTTENTNGWGGKVESMQHLIGLKILGVYCSMNVAVIQFEETILCIFGEMVVSRMGGEGEVELQLEFHEYEANSTTFWNIIKDLRASNGLECAWSDASNPHENESDGKEYRVRAVYGPGDTLAFAMQVAEDWMISIVGNGRLGISPIRYLEAEYKKFGGEPMISHWSEGGKVHLNPSVGKNERVM